MSHCIHCSQLKVHKEPDEEHFMYCSYSFRMIAESEVSFTAIFDKITQELLNSDADTPSWCPLGLK